MKHLLSIQYLRGIAAVMVVLHHILEVHPSEPHWISLGEFSLGAFGVDIFFVISGFIMWTSAKARPYGPGNFMLRRIVRVVPLYWTITLITAFASNPTHPTISIPAVDPLLRSLFFIPQWSLEFEGLIVPIVKVGWTIELEMLFYLFFTFILTLPSTLRLWAGCGVLVALPLLGAIAGPFSFAPFELYTQSVVVDFAYGLLLGAAYSHFDRQPLSGLETGPNVQADADKAPSILKHWRSSNLLWVAIGFSLVVIGFLIAPEEGKYSSIRGLVWGVPATLIVAGALLMENSLKLVPISFLKVIGDASYSLYLFHLLILAITERTLGVWLASSYPWLALVSQTLICVLVTYTIYLALEKPITRSLNRWARSFTNLQSTSAPFPNKRHFQSRDNQADSFASPAPCPQETV